METAALDLLGLPDDLLSGALSRLCSAIALVNLAATCTRLRALCKQAAEVLLEEAGAAATTIAARIAGAFTLRNLALLCGRAPLITERFHEHVQTVATEVLRSAQMSLYQYMPPPPLGCDVTIDWAALQLLFVAFGDVGPPTSGIDECDIAISDTLTSALECMKHGERNSRSSQPPGASVGNSGPPSQACLRACHVLQAMRIFDRSSASRLIDWRSKLQDLSGEDAPDDDPSANFDDSEEELMSDSLEEFADDVGVVIEHQWYGRKEDFFDLPDNFPGDSDEADGPCDQEKGCCHNASCWVEHGCMCMSAGHVFDRARRLQMQNGSGSCEDQGNVDLAAHFVASKLWRRIRTPCPAAGRKVAWLARHAAWRREGQANAAATLAALGIRVVEGVPFGEGPPFEACFRGGSLECPELFDAERA